MLLGRAVVGLSIKIGGGVPRGRASSALTLELEGVGTRCGWRGKTINVVVRVIPVFLQEGVDVPRDVGEGHAFTLGSRGSRERGSGWGFDLDGQVLACNHDESMGGRRERRGPAALALG